jgi:hypothetical protein
MIIATEHQTYEDIRRAWTILHRLDQDGDVPHIIMHRLGQLADSDRSALIVTNEWYPITKPIVPYFAINRRYSPHLQFIEYYPEGDQAWDIALISHELTHAVGGDEEDAEATEMVVLDRFYHQRDKARISQQELDSFGYGRAHFYKTYRSAGKIWVETPTERYPLWATTLTAPTRTEHAETDPAGYIRPPPGSQPIW